MGLRVMALGNEENDVSLTLRMKITYLQGRKWKKYLNFMFTLVR